MTLEEKLAMRKAEKAKEERFFNICGLVICWTVVLPLMFHLLTTGQIVQAMDVGYRDRMIAYGTETWWILIPLIAGYYRIKCIHRALGI